MNTVPRLLSEKKTQLIVSTLLCLSPLIGMAVDLVAPSLPAISTSLQVAPGVAKSIISIYLLGYAFGNFFTGLLTDSLGRQQLLRYELLGFVLASFVPVLFPNIHSLLLARFLQGLTIGGVAVVTRSIYSDILPAEKLIRLGPLLGMMWGLGPVLGPAIGGYLQFYFGWEAGFCFFGISTFILFLIIFVIVPETHFNRHPLNIGTMKQNLSQALSHRVFVALMLLMGLTYSLLIVFNTLGPFLIQTEFHHSSVFFGHMALCLGLVFLISTICCRHLLKHHLPEKLFFIAVNATAALALGCVIVSYFFSESMSVIAIGSAIMFFGCGFIFPMAMGKGMSLFRHIAGTASAVMYLVNVLLTSFVSFLMTFTDMKSVVPFMWIYFGLMLISVAVYWPLIHNSERNVDK